MSDFGWAGAGRRSPAIGLSNPESQLTGPRFVGRRAELEVVSRCIARLSLVRPEPQLLEVTGDPGIGKTALLAEVGGLARAAGLKVLGGRPRRGQSYGCWGDLLTARAALVSDQLVDWSPADLAALTTVAPDLVTQDTHDLHSGTPVSGTATLVRPAGESYRLVYRLVEGLAESGLVLLLDDMHDADRDSVRLLAELLRRPPERPVLFVVVYRDRQATPSLREAVLGHARELVATRLRLGPLAEGDVESIVAGRLPSSLARRLHQDSGGNPAYLHALADEQREFLPYLDPVGPDVRTTSGAYAPFVSELDHLSDDVRSVAEAAAVIGDQFEADLVAQVLGRGVSEVFMAIGELIHRDLVKPVMTGQCYAFRHSVLRRAICQHTELSRRVEMHSRADEVLAQRGAPLSQRAAHVAERARFGDLDAVAVLSVAGQEIMLTQPNTAAAWLGTALRIIPSDHAHDEIRAMLLVHLAKARGATGYLQDCRDILHEALRYLPAEPKDVHARVTAFTAMVQRLLCYQAESEALLLSEVDSLGAENMTTCVQLKFEIAAAHFDKHDIDACVHRASEALEIAETSGLRRLQATCHGLLGMAHATAGATDKAVEHVAKAATLLDGLLDNEFALATDAVVWIGWSEVLLDHWDDAIRHFDKAVELGTQHGYRLAMPQLLAGQVFALRHKGRIEEAHLAAEHAVHLAHRSASSEHLACAYAFRSWTNSILGRTDRALRDDLSATRYRIEPVRGWLAALSVRLLAEARLLGGDEQGCLALAAGLSRNESTVPDMYSEVAWCELLTRANLAAGYQEAAAALAKAAADAATSTHPGSAGMAHLATAQVLLATDPDSSAEPAQLALAALDQAGRTLDALRARAVYGTSLWHQGDHDAAVREVKAAQLGFEQLGATALARCTRTERRRLTAKAPRGGGSEECATTLTRREQQVADLVQQGLTNRLIARRLNIADKTVEMHLGNVFAKLGVTSRAAVATAVTRDRIDSPSAQ